MQKLKMGKEEKIRQKLITVTPLDIVLQNGTRHEIHYEVAETLDGIRPRILIKIRRLKKSLFHKKRKKRVHRGTVEAKAEEDSQGRRQRVMGVIICDTR